MSANIGLSLSSTKLEVAPGESVEAIVTIRNQGQIVDQFGIRIQGLDPAWWTLSTPSVPLFPGDQGEAKLTIHPPKEAEAKAGSYSFQVRAVSQASPEEMTEEEAYLILRGFLVWDAEMSPTKVVGESGTYRLTASNSGNTDITLIFEGKDPEEALNYTFNQDKVTVPAGESALITLTVRPKKGEKGELYSFQVLVRPAEAKEPSREAKTINGQLEYRRRRGSAWKWLLLVLALLAAAFAIWKFIPPLLVPHFTITITNTAEGTVTTPGTGTYTYEKGTVVNLVATPASGYRFFNWTGNVITIASVNAATTTITMNADYSIKANFVKQYNLAISSTAGGSVTTPAVGTVTYDTGTVVNLVATPAAGYRFVNWTGDVGTIANVNAAATTITMHGDYSITANFEYTPVVSAGWLHTVGVKSDGTVVAVGDNSAGQCAVSGWTGIVQVAAGGAHTVGLKSDGTVVAVGDNDYGQCNVSGWTDIVQVAAGWYHTVGLKSDGTVVAVGYNDYGQCAVGGWTGIVQVAAGGGHTVGVKSDGTVVAVGNNDYGQCNVSGWMLK